jgi:hypothetical protein
LIDFDFIYYPYSKGIRSINKLNNDPKKFYEVKIEWESEERKGNLEKTSRQKLKQKK